MSDEREHTDRVTDDAIDRLETERYAMSLEQRIAELTAETTASLEAALTEALSGTVSEEARIAHGLYRGTSESTVAASMSLLFATQDAFEIGFETARRAYEVTE